MTKPRLIKWVCSERPNLDCPFQSLPAEAGNQHQSTDGELKRLSPAQSLKGLGQEFLRLGSFLDLEVENRYDCTLVREKRIGKIGLVKK
jgi:hypothetical protein